MGLQLSATERKVLQHLGWGKNYTQIAWEMRKSKANITTVASRIRIKTGIQDTTNVEQCRAWIRQNRVSLLQMERGPSKAQREVLWLLGQGHDINTIATLRATSNQCVMNHACSGRHRAKIYDNLPSSIVAWFQKEKEERENQQTLDEWEASLPPRPSPVQPQQVTGQNTPVTATHDPMDDPAF